MSDKKVRILCLHGYRQNNVLFREKTGSIRKLMKKYADFEFLSAPLTPNITGESDRDDARAWWFSRASNEFSSKDITELATGFQDSVDCVVNFVKEKGPFDGILGFSQGASMAHLLLALEEQKHICLGFKFAMFFAGFLSLSSIHEVLLSSEFLIPALHVYGESDDIVKMERSMELQSKFKNSVSVTHDGGHCVPSMSKSKETLRDFLEKQLKL